jgi:hypothetical protein
MYVLWKLEVKKCSANSGVYCRETACSYLILSSRDSGVYVTDRTHQKTCLCCMSQ